MKLFLDSYLCGGDVDSVFLSDAASSLVQILGFKLSAKKPDPTHPFGHGRLEYVAGLIISFFLWELNL